MIEQTLLLEAQKEALRGLSARGVILITKERDVEHIQQLLRYARVAGKFVDG
jgi:hypothetical protein